MNVSGKISLRETALKVRVREEPHICDSSVPERSLLLSSSNIYANEVRYKVVSSSTPHRPSLAIMLRHVVNYWSEVVFILDKAMTYFPLFLFRKISPELDFCFHWPYEE